MHASGQGAHQPFRLPANETAVLRFASTAVVLFSEIKQLFGRYLKHFAELENHIKRNAHISQLDCTDVAAIHVNKLGQFHLRQGFFLR